MCLHVLNTEKSECSTPLQFLVHVLRKDVFAFQNVHVRLLGWTGGLDAVRDVSGPGDKDGMCFSSFSFLGFILLLASKTLPGEFLSCMNNFMSILALSFPLSYY